MGLTANNHKEDKHIQIISQALSISANQVKSTLLLFGQGATIPFVARYRKEATGGLDELQLADIRDRKEKLEEIDKRRESILASLKENELLTAELEDQIMKAETLTELEDIYLPFRPKRKTPTIFKLLQHVLSTPKKISPPPTMPSPAPAILWPNGSARTSQPATGCAGYSGARQPSDRKW